MGGSERFLPRLVKKKKDNRVREQCFSEVDIMPENLNESDKDDQLRKEYS